MMVLEWYMFNDFDFLYQLSMYSIGPVEFANE